MRVMYITNGFPWPLTSGYLRHYFLIKELARRHGVTLLSLALPGFQSEHVKALEPFTERVCAFPGGAPRRSFPDKALRHLRRLTGRIPAVRELTMAAERLVRGERFDVVVFSGRETFPALRAVRGLPVVADVCDAASVRVRGQMRRASFGRRTLLALESARVSRIERLLLEAASHVLFASCRDRDALCGGPSDRATVIPNGVDLEYWQRSDTPRGNGTPTAGGIVFTGAMDYRPNVDCALHLIHDVLPLVRRSRPDAELWIVGRDPSPQLREAGRRPGVTVTGFVDDVRPYLEQAAVFAAPLRFGAGIQNKLLEAMAMEVPVVASSLAAAGLRPADGAAPPIEIADDRADFAALVCRGLNGASVSPVRDEAARSFVRQHFNWQRSGELLERVLTTTAQSWKGTL